MESSAAEWFTDWFDEDYSALYRHRNPTQAIEQVRMLVSRLGLEAGDRVLDAACGPGRHLAALCAMGMRAVGFDLSPHLLSQVTSSGRAVRADLRRLPFQAESFQLVASFFTSFGYFEDPADDVRVLGNLAEMVSPGGYLFLDLLNPDSLPEEFSGSEEATLPDGRLVRTTKCRDGALIFKEIRIRNPLGADRRTMERIRTYTMQDASAMLDGLGMSVDSVYGTEAGDPWNPRSPRLSIVARHG